MSARKEQSFACQGLLSSVLCLVAHRRVKQTLDKYAKFFQMAPSQHTALMTSVSGFAEDFRRQAAANGGVDA